jgi:putative GTP pyrophosphokinase
MLPWNELVKPYDILLSEVKTMLEKSNNIFQRQLGYAPIETIKCRLKTEESTRKKLERKELQFEEGSIRGLTDLAGMRVVCKFIDDIPEIAGLVKSWEKFKINNEGSRFGIEQLEIVDEQNFIASPKESGYRSHHLVIRKNGLLFEMQIRTIAMDFWASTEHMLKYKYGGDLPADIRVKLRSIADIGSTLDLAMNDIRQDVKIGTVKERILDEFNKALRLLDENGLSFKSDKYRSRLDVIGDDLNALKSIATEAKEDVPRQFWQD